MIDESKIRKTFDVKSKLLQAVKNNDLEEIKNVFFLNSVLHGSGQALRDLDMESPFNVLDEDDIKYAIWEACERGDLKIISYLLGKTDFTELLDFAVMHSSKKGQLHAVKYLVDLGADITAAGNFTVIAASQENHLDTVKYLVENGADISADDDFPIRFASSHGNLEMVKYLVENGADIFVDDNYPIRVASSRGDLEMVKYLVKSGADIFTDNTFTIRIASKEGHLELIKYLVYLGADLSICDNFPVKVARSEKKVAASKYISDYVLNEMLMQTLFMLLNRKKTLTTAKKAELIHKDLIASIEFKYQKHYRFYLGLRK